MVNLSKTGRQWIFVDSVDISNASSQLFKNCFKGFLDSLGEYFRQLQPGNPYIIRSCALLKTMWNCVRQHFFIMIHLRSMDLVVSSP